MANEKTTPTNSRTPQPIRRSSTAPNQFVLKRSGPIPSLSSKVDIDIAYRHKRGARSVSNDEVFAAQRSVTCSAGGDTNSAEQASSVTSDSKKGVSLFRRISKVGSSSLKSISGTVKRATSTRIKTGTVTRPAQARGRHERSVSESQVYTRPNLLSSGISELEDKPTATLAVKDNKSKMNVDGDDVKVPLLLQQGTPMTKVSASKKKTCMFRIDADQGYMLWESKKSGLIPIENIKEIRSGSEARYYREQFQLSEEYENRWLTIIYIVDGNYKTLHVIAASADVFTLWDRTLRDLFAVRKDLMSGLGHVEKRQAVWERRYWKSADVVRDDKLMFEEVEKMCVRLNISFSHEDLLRQFNMADSKSRGYLDFEDFRQFVKLLKERPEISRLYKRLSALKNDVFDFDVFKAFMVNHQKSSLGKSDLEAVFRKYATTSDPNLVSPPLDPGAPAVPATDPGSGSENPPDDHSASSNTPLPPTPPVDQKAVPSSAPSETPLNVLACNAPSDDVRKQAGLSELTMSLDAFTSFLLSSDNAVFSDQHSTVYHDMNRPLSEYFISSSHNTYLVGHQLVGVSTIEGYIRALLHSCRSVELDIYDGEVEPVIYHGKTFTSKVPLRDICQAIAKYAFVASPYPIIISAEVHCSLPQQDLIARVMRETFGDSLVQAPVDNRPKIEKLPSPEDLKGKVLLKAKNLCLTEKDGLTEKSVTVDTESSSTDTTDASASDSEFIRDIAQDPRREKENVRSVYAVKEIRDELAKITTEPMKEIKEMKAEIKEMKAEVEEKVGKARALYDRVRRKKSPSPAPVGRHIAPAIGPVVSAASLAAPGVPPPEPTKVKMSLELVALLVYTVGVKCRGFNKKETYAPEHIFSLSERMANKVLKQSPIDLVKHNKTHLVRIYPNGTRLNSSNFEPHKYWCAGAQLVAINWQTFDLGYMINHTMFQRNGRAGYVLKPEALRNPNKEALSRRTAHFLDLTVLSAQQLPRRKDSGGREIVDSNIIDPYVEVTIHVPDWTRSPFVTETPSTFAPSSSAQAQTAKTASSTSTSYRTNSVKNNGFNPVWEETMHIPFDCVADMFDLIFVRFTIKDDNLAEDDSIAVYCVPLGSLQQGYRHLPLHDAQLSQYLFSTLFVKIGIREALEPPLSP